MQEMSTRKQSTRTKFCTCPVFDSAGKAGSNIGTENALGLQPRNLNVGGTTTEDRAVDWERLGRGDSQCLYLWEVRGGDPGSYIDQGLTFLRLRAEYMPRGSS